MAANNRKIPVTMCNSQGNSNQRNRNIHSHQQIKTKQNKTKYIYINSTLKTIMIPHKKSAQVFPITFIHHPPYAPTNPYQICSNRCYYRHRLRIYFDCFLVSTACLLCYCSFQNAHENSLTRSHSIVRSFVQPKHSKYVDVVVHFFFHLVCIFLASSRYPPIPQTSHPLFSHVYSNLSIYQSINQSIKIYHRIIW